MRAQRCCAKSRPSPAAAGSRPPSCTRGVIEQLAYDSRALLTIEPCAYGSAPSLMTDEHAYDFRALLMTEMRT
jgi:hypothetical protein